MVSSRQRFLAAILSWSILAPAAIGKPRVDALGDPLPEGAIARLGTMRMRHFSLPDRLCFGLGCITWSPNGKMIATTSFAAGRVGVQARLWEATTGKPLSVLENNERHGPSVVCFSPDNKTLAAAAGKRIVLWDVATGKEIGQLTGHEAQVEALGFQDGGKGMVSVAGDGAVYWWDVAAKKPTRTWQSLADEPKKTKEGDAIRLTVTNASLSTDGKWLAFEKWSKTENGFDRWGTGTIIVFDLAKRRECWREDRKDAGFWQFAFAPDGKRIVVSCGEASLREVATGRKLAVAPFRWGGWPAFSPDGRTVAVGAPSGGSGSELTFWSMDDTKSVRRVPLLQVAPIAFSPDSKKVAIGVGMTWRVLDAASGNPALYWPSYDQRLEHIAFSQDGRNLLVSHGRFLTTVDTATWRQQSQVEPSLKKFTGVQAIAKDGKLCVAADGKHADALFDMKTGRVLARLDAPQTGLKQHAGFFSPRSTLYVMYDSDGQGKEIDTLFAIPSGKQVAGWIKDLGSDLFRVRDRATKELERLGELAAEPLRKALADNPSEETRRRLEQLLGKLNHLTPSQLRYLRGIEILEGIGTPEAVRVIERLTEGNPAGLATIESRMVMARMRKRT